MPAYPIEILNFGDPSFDTHHDVIKKLNSLQGDFDFVLPHERNRLWAAPFKRDSYKSDYIWKQLEEYRSECKGFHPFIIAIVHGSLSSNKWGNLFGNRHTNAKDNGFAVVTTNNWDKNFAPPSLSVYLTYSFTI